MPELNDEQTRELNRIDKLLQFLDSEGTPIIWEGYLPFKEEVDLIRGYKGQINDLIPTKQKSGKTETESKESLKKSFAEATGKLFSIAGVYARKFGDATLEGQVKRSASDILNLKDTEIIGLANSLTADIFTAALLANTDFIPYGITLGKVNAAKSFGTRFDTKIGLGQSIEVISDSANVEITDITVLSREAVATLLDLKGHFDDGFVNGLERAASRDDIGVRHTGLRATITVGGVGVKGGKLMIGSKVFESNAEGNVKPMYVRAGNKNVRVELEGKPAKEFVHLFIKGHVDKMNFEF